jgi:hypothetical protein
MSWFSAKCPVAGEDKVWIEESVLWLIEEFGGDALRDCTVILPTDEFFPDPFSEEEEDVRALVDRVCGYMGVAPERVELNFFTDEDAALRLKMPSCESSHGGIVGHYQKRRGKYVISIESAQAREPTSLVATIAHELGHARLLGEARVHPGYEDHEPLTDLLTVFLGLGVFTGNDVFSFRQWTDAFSQGWQTERRGYMTEEMFGYALGLFAWLRGESNPGWSKYLKGNVSAYFKSSHKYLEKAGATSLQRL